MMSSLQCFLGTLLILDHSCSVRDTMHAVHMVCIPDLPVAISRHHHNSFKNAFVS